MQAILDEQHKTYALMLKNREAQTVPQSDRLTVVVVTFDFSEYSVG
jgi:hypothetical protein